ncbi:MAG: hypothetical protein WCO06_05685 [Candidatus Roizmanbacteria bacterium]
MDPIADSPEQIDNTQLLFSWKAPLRAYKKRAGKAVRFYLALAFLLSVIVFFFGDRILIVPIWAVLFLFYVLTITPPPEVENRVTTFGIETAGIMIRWDILSHFYFMKRFGLDVLVVVTQGPYFLHSYMVIPNEVIRARVKMILLQHIHYIEKPHQTITDRIINLFTHLIPDDGEPQHHAPVDQKPRVASL